MLLVSNPSNEVLTPYPIIRPARVKRRRDRQTAARSKVCGADCASATCTRLTLTRNPRDIAEDSWQGRRDTPHPSEGGVVACIDHVCERYISCCCSSTGSSACTKCPHMWPRDNAWPPSFPKMHSHTVLVTCATFNRPHASRNYIEMQKSQGYAWFKAIAGGYHQEVDPGKPSRSEQAVEFRHIY